MKLVEFSVTNYRSITTAHKIVLQDKTILVGKNNEGKSNLLTALNIAMMAMMYHARDEYRYGNFYGNRLYNWNRDFPVQYQGRKNGLESIFKLHFRLEEEELTEFHDLTKIRGNEDIPVTVKFGKDNEPKIEVPKRGSSSYNKKSKQITEFISRNIYFNYIQAIRTEDMAIEALQRVIWDELRQLSTNEEYVEALAKVEKLEQEVLSKLSDQLVDPLKAFLPNLQEISIKKSRDNGYLRRNSSSIDVFINDGHLTSIANKGDGIKSLVTLAVLKERSTKRGASIIAIEEPESHLHSGAIHSLINVIDKIAENSQVIITTHNPLFVQQNKLSANILVDSGMARTAKSISEIRKILGVMPSDNLQNSRYVLLVEGEDDKIALEHILKLKSVVIKSALASNQLVIKPMSGASNLLHDALDLKNSLCMYTVLLDNDKAGKEAFEKAKKNGVVSEANVKQTICNGLPEAEFEDCLKPVIYERILSEEYNVNIKCKSFKSTKKWSDRLKDTFLSQGSMWNDVTEKHVKELVAKSVLAYDDVECILIKEKSGFIDGLIMAIEKMIGSDI